MHCDAWLPRHRPAAHVQPAPFACLSLPQHSFPRPFASVLALASSSQIALTAHHSPIRSFHHVAAAVA